MARVPELVARAVDLGCPCLGLTDHGLVSGHPDLERETKKAGIKPVYGCELYHGVDPTVKGNKRDQAHLIALAKTTEGRRNLWRLVDKAAYWFHHVPRINWEDLKLYSEGLILTSACIQSLVCQGLLKGDLSALNRYAEIARDDFYIELHTYPTDEAKALNLILSEVGQERGFPFVYADDAHFAFPEQYEVHDAYIARQTGDNIYMPISERKMWHPRSLYIKTEEEIRTALSYLPENVVDEAIENSIMIGESCDATLPDVRSHVPVFVPSECPWLDTEKTAAQILIELVKDGIQVRYGSNNGEAVDRAIHELKVFLGAGLEHYLLLTWDMMRFCDEEGIIRGPGRGSAGGSIVAYALNITDVDPLHYDLIFERFYNAGRTEGLPDIDTDFGRESRKKVKAYLEERWGKDNVRSIGNIIRLKPKGALEKTYACCDVPWKVMNDIKQIVDTIHDLEISGMDDISWSDSSKPVCVMDAVGERIEKYVAGLDEETETKTRRWLELVEVVVGRVGGYGVHASGVVCSDIPLQDELPGRWAVKPQMIVTQFPMTEVEKRRFLKEDLLGLRNLDTLEVWVERVAKKGIKVTWSGLDKQEHPEEMWQMLDAGLTLGVFNIEDGYGSRLCKEIQPRNVLDLAVIVALNRPGPIASEAPDSFIRRRRGQEDDKFDGRNIDVLSGLLEESYGWFLYQEQVIRFFEALGYSLSDADGVRKILGKKKQDQMRQLRVGEGEWEGRGYDTIALNTLTAELCDQIWSVIADFSKYSFNKSHAVEYGVMALRTIYAMYIDAPQYIISCILTNSEDTGQYIGQARRMGIQIHAPDIHKSIHEIEEDPETGNIYLGFSNINGLGKYADYIVELREKYNLDSPFDLNRALDRENALHKRRKDKAKETGEEFTEISPRSKLKRDQIEAMWNAGVWDSLGIRDVDLRERQKLEKELLGVIITDDAVEVLEDNWEELEDCDDYADVDRPWETMVEAYGLDDGEDKLYFTVPAIITEIRETRTKAANKAMAIMKSEYQGDQLEFAVFPNEWKRFKRILRERTPAKLILCRRASGLNLNGAKKLS